MSETLQEIVNHQAEMESLWIDEPSITEYLLMAALRHLHAAIEGDREAACEAKKMYWDLESEL